jgi:hypothetical protein
LIYEGERPIFQKRGEREASEKVREEREQRNKKSEKK